MSTRPQRDQVRREALLDLLEQAEKDYGDRAETLLTAQAEFLRKVLRARGGAAAIERRNQEDLAALTVDKINDFFA